jgi:hypothetical protein
MTREKHKSVYSTYYNILSSIDIEKWPKLKRIYGFESKLDKKKKIKLFGWKQQFDINNVDQLIGLIEGLKVTGERLGWDIIGNPVIKATLDKLENIKREKEKYKTNLETVYNQLLELKKERLEMNLSRYENDINEFSKLLNTPTTPELDIQNWLKTHIWFLGFEYLDSQPVSPSQFKFDDSIFDFFLQRFDTAFDIIEIKTFDANIFVGEEQFGQQSVSRSNPMSSSLGKAISQMIHYLDIAQHKQKELLEKDKIDVYYPRGIIIIGRTPTDTAKKRLRSVTAYLRDINIMSYDQLLDKAKNSVNHIKTLRP